MLLVVLPILLVHRTIVKSGVCAADTSAVLNQPQYVNVRFPAATHDRSMPFICYGRSLNLDTTITVGTGYAWTPIATLP